MIKVNKKQIGVGIIFAADGDNGIGKDGKMPWHFPEDLQEFKKATLGKPIIMGRKTWESLDCKVLPGRLHIVITSHDFAPQEGVVYVSGFHSAFQTVEKTGADFAWVVGGVAVIEAAMDYVDILQITDIFDPYDTDVRLPNHIFDSVSDYMIASHVIMSRADFDITRYYMTSFGKDYDSQKKDNS